MKDFFKYVLATIVGMLIMGLFTFLMFFIMLIALSASSGTGKVTDGSVLRIELKGTLSDQTVDNPLAQLLGNKNLMQQGLDNILEAIKEAKTNDAVKGIYIDAGAMMSDYASAEELRKALLDFKTSKKFIVAYGDNYSQGAYYVCSVADKVLINPEGMLDIHGVASTPIFYKELLDKVGVKMQVFRVGTYKSAVEPFIATEMSPANREQVTSYINDIWKVISTDISKSRSINIDSLNAIVDRYVMFQDSKEYKALKLVDQLTYIDEVRDMLRKMSGEERVTFVSPAQLAELHKGAADGETIAVYYASGNIVDEATSTAFGSESEIVGQKVIKDLDELAENEYIKAVVIRINSGGGSAYASEQMHRAISQLKKKKPVVVSMGGLAASGGYYMSCAADYIVAEPTTITGSIGIFGLIPDVSGLMTNKLGLHFDVVKTNEASDFGNMGRSFNEKESAALQAYVERGYGLFLKRVAEGRKMQTANVDSIAQGRVWTGSQALGLHLVDKLGTLDDAIAEAAKRAKVDKYQAVSFPIPLPWYMQLNDALSRDYLENHMQMALGEYYEPLRYVYSIKGKDCLQAKIPFEPNLK